MKAIAALHAADPKFEIFRDVNPTIGDIDPMGAEVLCAIYIRPQRTKSGIILTEKTQEEDIWQSKIGLILKMGPLAFTEDATHQWGDVRPGVGDWVAFRVGDTFMFILGERYCRLVQDVNIKAIVKRPDIVL